MSYYVYPQSLLPPLPEQIHTFYLSVVLVDTANALCSALLSALHLAMYVLLANARVIHIIIITMCNTVAVALRNDLRCYIQS